MSNSDSDGEVQVVPDHVFENAEMLAPIRTGRCTAMTWIRLRCHIQPLEHLVRVATAIADHLNTNSKVIGGVALQIVQIRDADPTHMALLAVQFIKGRSPLDTTFGRLVNTDPLSYQLIDWGRIKGLSSQSSIQRILIGKVEQRVQGLGTRPRANDSETDEDEDEVEDIDSNYDSLSKPALIRLAHGLKKLVQQQQVTIKQQQVTLDNQSAYDARVVYEGIRKLSDGIDYRTSELGQQFLVDMWELRRGFEYPEDIQSKSDRVQYLISLEDKRAEPCVLKQYHHQEQPVDHDAAQEEQVIAGYEYVHALPRDLPQIPSATFKHNGKEYPYTWDRACYAHMDTNNGDGMHNQNVVEPAQAVDDAMVEDVEESADKSEHGTQ